MSRRPRPVRTGPISVPRAVASFLVAGLVAVAAAGTLLALAQRRQAVAEAVRDARSLTSVEAYDVVGPALTDAALRPGPELDALDRLVRERVLGDQIVRVKIWDRTGRVAYSDDRSLVGQRFELGAEEQAALRDRGQPVAGVTDLDEEEHRHERQFGKLLQVYLGVRTPEGTPLLFETYQRYDVIRSASQRLWLASLPILLGGLVLLYLVQAPLAYRMACRLRDAQEERERLLISSLATSDGERRQIAADLHDGVVQGLTGASYALSAASERARASGQEELAQVAETTGADLRRWVRELRSLVLTITPPALHQQGLSAALSDLAATLESRGTRVELSVDPALRLEESDEALVYRVAQEAVRNVARHAAATHVLIGVAGDPAGEHVRMTVADDGVGFDPAGREARRQGSVGLELLRGLVSAQGGRLTVSSAPRQGSVLEMSLPIRATAPERSRGETT